MDFSSHTENHVTPGRTDIHKKSTSIERVISLNTRKTPDSGHFSLYFITSTLSKMSRVQKHSKVMFLTFRKSSGVDRGLELLTSRWENSLHLGALRATNIVRGDDGDDDSLFAEYREAGERGKCWGGKIGWL